jgi:hypothetical protein
VCWIPQFVLKEENIQFCSHIICFYLFINSLKENLSNLGMGTRAYGQDSNQVPLQWNSVTLLLEPLEPTRSEEADKGILLGQQNLFKIQIQIQACAHYILYVFMRQSRWLGSAHVRAGATSWRYVSECPQANTGTALSKSHRPQFTTLLLKQLTLRSEALHKKLTVAQLPKVPWPCSQEPENENYPEPNGSSPHIITFCFKAHINIVTWRLNAGSVQSEKHRRDIHCWTTAC